MDDELSTPAVIRCPYPLGTIVYHRTATRKTPGLIVGWCVTEAGMKAFVTWGDDRSETWHYLIELTTEYEPTVA